MNITQYGKYVPRARGGVLYGPDGEILLHGNGSGGVGRYTRTGGPQEDVHLRTGDATGSFAFVEAQGGAHLVGNAYWDGTNWMRFNTGQAAYHLVLNGNNAPLDFQYAAAGANPITWTSLEQTQVLGGSALQKWMPGLQSFVSGARFNHLTGNLYYDGAAWNLYNTAASGLMLRLTEGGTLDFYYATAGANPRPLAQVGGWPIYAMTLWTNLSYAANWSSYGSGQATGQYRVGADGRCYLKGLVKKAVAVASPGNDVIATLPVNVRPSTEHIFVVQQYPGANNTAELRVNASGAVYLVNSPAGGATWTSLAQVAFDLST